MDTPSNSASNPKPSGSTSLGATPPSRTASEARALLDDELAHLESRRAALGEAGAHAVAAWSLQNAYEFEAAILAWCRTVELEPRNLEARFNEGVCRLELGAWDEAGEIFRTCLELDAAHADDPDVASLDWEEQDPAYRLGNALHGAGDLAAAIDAYEQSARRNVLATDALRELIRCHLALRAGEAALEAIARLERRTGRLSVRAECQAYRGEAQRMIAEPSQ